MSAPNTRARQSVLGIVALSLFAALFTRLWYLQVLTTEEYEVAAEAVRTEEVILEAPRGRILDRQGKVLVENTRVIQVSVDYQDFTELETPEQSELLRNLSREVTLDEQLRFQGVRASDDPGGDRLDTDELPSTTSLPGDGSSSTTTSTTTTTTDPDDPEATSALDPSAPGGQVEAPVGPYEEQPASFGVATGADNPDGAQGGEADAPDPVTEDVLRERIDDPRFSKFKPVPVATGVSEDLEAYLTEHPEDFPTVVVERTTVRKYNYGALAAHVLGYVGDVGEEDDDLMESVEGKPYETDDEIGKAGIERGMEGELRGTPGRRVYEVDARNRPIREVDAEFQEPQPGRDVYLTIDINMQYLAEMGLAAEAKRRTGQVDSGCFVVDDVGNPTGCEPKGAASVAIDPRDGQVLAMASYPTYDPNLFVGGISQRNFLAIADDDPAAIDIHNSPLLNRTIAGTYAPGSTFKLFSSYAGLATGLITPDSPFDDTGVYAFSADCDTSVPQDQTNCYAQNAGRTPHGTVRLAEALTVSSDTYYYALGDRSWKGRESLGSDHVMQDQLEVWGLGEPTGIELPSERAGRIPTPEWLLDFSIDINGNTEEGRELGRWQAGNSANTMVGQGDVLVTPLQLAQGYATLANGGTIWKPQLVLQVTDFAASTNTATLTPEQTGTVPFQPNWREAMIAGFDGVTKDGDGTAASAFGGFDQSTCPVAGKTGTAQVTGKNDSSLFTAFAPTPTPERPSVIAMATVFDQAGFGAQAAVPLTRRVLQPFAAYGCDIDRFGEPGDPVAGISPSEYTAPLGGYFDVDAAIEAFVPPVAATRD